MIMAIRKPFVYPIPFCSLCYNVSMYLYTILQDSNSLTIHKIIKINRLAILEVPHYEIDIQSTHSNTYILKHIPFFAYIKLCPKRNKF